MEYRKFKMPLLPSPDEKPLDEQEIEKEYLKVPRFALRCMGHWPHDKLLSIRVLPLTILSLTILTLGVISEVSYSYTHIHNLPLALDALCPALTKGVTVVKFVMMLLTRAEVAKMLDDIKQKWINGLRFYGRLSMISIHWIFSRQVTGIVIPKSESSTYRMGRCYDFNLLF